MHQLYELTNETIKRKRDLDEIQSVDQSADQNVGQIADQNVGQIRNLQMVA